MCCVQGHFDLLVTAVHSLTIAMSRGCRARWHMEPLSSSSRTQWPGTASTECFCCTTSNTAGGSGLEHTHGHVPARLTSRCCCCFFYLFVSFSTSTSPALSRTWTQTLYWLSTNRLYLCTLLTCHEESIDSCSSLKALNEILRRARISVAADFWRTRQQRGHGGVSHDTWDHSGFRPMMKRCQSRSQKHAVASTTAWVCGASDIKECLLFFGKEIVVYGQTSDLNH